MWFYMLCDGWFISAEDRYDTRDKAIAEVERRNAIEPRRYTCLGVPETLIACEGCEGPAGIFYDTGTEHLVKITWQYCHAHEYVGTYSAEY